MTIADLISNRLEAVPGQYSHLSMAPPFCLGVLRGEFAARGGLGGNSELGEHRLRDQVVPNLVNLGMSPRSLWTRFIRFRMGECS